MCPASTNPGEDQNRVDAAESSSRPAPTDRSIPEIYDALVSSTARWAAENPAPEWELHSDRALSGNDRNGYVQLTVRDFTLASLRLDPDWMAVTPGEMIEQLIVSTVNEIIGAYLAEELSAAKDASSSMGEVQRELAGFSGEVHSAFNRVMEDLTERMRRA